MTAQTLTHHTAWLVNDPSALETGCMDITIIPDTITGYRQTADGAEEPIWSSDSTVEQPFHAVTTVDAKSGDVQDAINEAEELMSAAGWRTAGDWEAVDNAYIVTVEYDA